MRRLWLSAVLVCSLLGQVAPASAEQLSPDAVAGVRLARARETRAFTERHFQHLAGGPDCPRAVFVSYAQGDRQPEISDQWFDVSQISADLALAPPGDALGRCWANRGFTFLDRLWDRAAPF